MRPRVIVVANAPSVAEHLERHIQSSGTTERVELASLVATSQDGLSLNWDLLFDTLDRQQSPPLLDTLLVVDIGLDLEAAFQVDERLGGAVELLLRYPDLSVVFVSEVIPPAERRRKVAVPRVVGNSPLAFHNWIACIVSTLEPIKKLHAFTEQLLLRTPQLLSLPSPDMTQSDSDLVLAEVVYRFSKGMRLCFDPTGLRSLIRERFLHRVFGSDAHSPAAQPREDLLSQIHHCVVSVDEEADVALTSSYMAYRMGYRAWLVTTFSEFKGIERGGSGWRSELLWAAEASAESLAPSVSIVRDLDLRFPDYPLGSTPMRRPPDGATTPLGQCREDLRDISKWGITVPAEASRFQDRVLSGDGAAIVEQPATERSLPTMKRTARNPSEASPPLPAVVAADSHPQTGQRTAARLPGRHKPVGALHGYTDLFPKAGLPSQLARLRALGAWSGTHSAPYHNLHLATCLVRRAREMAGRWDLRSCINRGLLAHDAYCLLLGMSSTLALEALRELHSAEATAEAHSLGAANALSTSSRAKELSATLAQLMPDRRASVGSRATAIRRRSYLAQTWAELRGVYRDGEQFRAAEEANRLSLAYEPTFCSWPPQPHSERIIRLRLSILYMFSSFPLLLTALMTLTLALSVAYAGILASIPERAGGTTWRVDLIHWDSWGNFAQLCWSVLGGILRNERPELVIGGMDMREALAKWQLQPDGSAAPSISGFLVGVCDASVSIIGILVVGLLVATILRQYNRG